MTKPKGPAAKYSQVALEEALEAIKSKALSVRKAAIQYGVPRSTLQDKLLGKYPVQRVSHTVLTTEEETKLVKWMVICARLGEGKDREQLCRAVQNILNAEGRQTKFSNNKPGYQWYKAFMDRHKDKIREKKAMTLGEQRAQVSEKKIRAWFEHTKTMLSNDGIIIEDVPPTNIFNFDETGFPFFLGGTTIISDIQSKHPYQRGSDNKSQVTVLGCISAAGQVLKPTIIFPGARWTFQPWKEFDADFTLTPNGWINRIVFMKWLRYTFLPAVEHLQRPVVLFLDGHSSHITQEVHDFAQENSITIFVLPSHSSNIVQPLDLVFFGCLKHEWKLAVKDYKAISRFAQVTKHTFTLVFADAWRKAYSPEKLVNAFRALGLCPWNPEAPDYSKCEASALYSMELASPVDTIVEATSQADPDLPTPDSASPSGDAPPPHDSASPSGDALPPPDSASASGDVFPLIDSPSPSGDALPPPESASPPGDILPPPDSPSPPGDALPPPDIVVTASSSDITDVPPSPATASTSSSGAGAEVPSTPTRPATVRDESNIAFYLTQMIDHVIACGWTSVDMFHIRRRQFANVQATPSEPDYGKYLELWKKIVPPPNFDNLPIPTSSGRKTKGNKIQPPSYVSHASFKEFYEKKEKEEATKKKAQEERKADMMKKKEEKMKKKMEDMEKKRLEREKKKAEKLEKKRMELMMKGKGKGKGKKRKLPESESSDEEHEAVVLDDRSDEEFDLFNDVDVDESVCAV